MVKPAPESTSKPGPKKTPAKTARQAAQQTALAAAKPPLSAARKPVPRKDPTANQDHKRGLLFYKGIGVDKDFKKAAQWFRQAARKGHAGAHTTSES